MKFTALSQVTAMVTAFLISLVAFSSASAETTVAEQITVVGAPLGRFGFVTTYGGPIWRATIGRLVIKDVKPGGPAEKAGMQKGDEILTVDGLAVPGGRRSEVFRALRSKDAGQVVTFEVAPAKGGLPARVVRVRAVEKP